MIVPVGTSATQMTLSLVKEQPIVDVEPVDSVKRFFKKILRNISFAINKDWSAKKWGGYSMMILAK